jgi:hypothetical protein
MTTAVLPIPNAEANASFEPYASIASCLEMSMAADCQPNDGFCQAVEPEICHAPDMDAEDVLMARTRAGFRTTQAAADAIGAIAGNKCPRTLVWGWEHGTVSLKGSKYLLAAARAYRVRPEWLNGDDAADGFPWPESGQATPPTPPPIRALDDDLAVVVEAVSHAQALLAQALAATIPTAAREFVGGLDAKLPPELREIAYIQTLRQTVLRQLAHNDMGALRDQPETAPAKPRRKRH